MMRLAAVVLLSASCAIGQTEPRSASDLIQYLNYQSYRPDKHGVKADETTGLFSCGPAAGEDRDDRALTRSMVRLGASAVPALEEALDSFETRGEKSEVAFKAGWLLLAYAGIHGPAAVPRLRRLYDKPGLVNYAFQLDRAVALALGLTSYVSPLRSFHECTVPTQSTTSTGRAPYVAPSREIPLHNIRCDRGDEPKDALDRLILAWVTNDPESLEDGLGSRAKASLDQLLEGRTWTAMRADLWPSTAGKSVAMGYRFAPVGRWSEPDETLQDTRGPVTPEGNYANPEIETQLVNGSGANCGSLRVNFIQLPRSRFTGRPQEYSVDNADLAELLRLIGACSIDSNHQ
jgi:hypothetical protein